MRLWPALLGLLLLLAPLGATAQGAGGDFILPIGNVALLAPPDPPPPGGPFLYGATGPSPDWSIAQWNIPGGALPPFSAAGSVYTSIAAESQVRLSRRGAEIQVDLAQDGRVLPCTRADGQPRESDLLLAPNGLYVNAPGVPGLAPMPAHSQPLSALSGVVFSADVGLQNGFIARPKGCLVSQGNALAVVILTELDVPHPQTMFYQLQMSTLCAPQTAAQNPVCHGLPGAPLYFFRTNPFGATDFLPLLGTPYLQSGAARHLRLDLLPRLRLVIANGPPGLDHDPAHWTVSGMYVGQHIWGDVRLRSSWHGIHLAIIP